MQYISTILTLAREGLSEAIIWEWLSLPAVRVPASRPALWARRVVVHAIVTLQICDVGVRRVGVRHVAGRRPEVVRGRWRSVQVVPVHLKHKKTHSKAPCTPQILFSMQYFTRKIVKEWPIFFDIEKRFDNN